MSKEKSHIHHPVPGKKPVFSHRACYICAGEHTQNSWMPNYIYPREQNNWTRDDWQKFLRMIKAFGYTNFQYLISPTIFDLPSLKGGGIYQWFAETMREVADLAHAEGLEIQCVSFINVLGPKWFYACPNIPEERSNILKLFRHWMHELSGIDAVTLFPGDLGGCRENGCTHETAIDLDLEIAGIIKQESPKTRIEISTWGNPFVSWGDDAIDMPGWNRSAVDMFNSGSHEFTFQHLHGTPERAKAAFDYLAKRLPQFPKDTTVDITLSLNKGGSGAPYAREIANLCPVLSWDYDVSEDDNLSPHWRLDSMAYARQAEHEAAPYIGGIIATTSPKLNLLNLYGGAQTFIDPWADPTELSTHFCSSVFGPEHKDLGNLFKVFELAPIPRVDKHDPQWAEKTRTPYHNYQGWTKNDCHRAFELIIEHLEAAKASDCKLPIFPDPETYRKDLLWFAHKYHEMTGPNPNRALIAWQYWEKAYAIYQRVPMGYYVAMPHCRIFANSFSDIPTGKGSGDITGKFSKFRS